MQGPELLDIVDENGRALSTASRAECHGNPSLLHQVVHVLVRNSAGELLLQLRSPGKDIQPGRWDTSVGGHFDHGEGRAAALAREVKEEIGVEISAASCEFCYSYILRNEIESELVHTFLLNHEGPFQAAPEEITELRFWSLNEIDSALGSGIFTPNFADEYRRYCNWSSLRENRSREEDCS